MSHTEANRRWRAKHPNYDRDWARKHPHRDNGNFRRKPEASRAQQQAKKIPLGTFCEVCPEDDVRKATQRHHPDYNYPEIFVSCCPSCHKYMESGLTTAFSKEFRPRNNHKWMRLSGDFIQSRLCKCQRCLLRASEDDIRQGGLGLCEPLSPSMGDS
jgi:hypothetical protein